MNDVLGRVVIAPGDINFLAKDAVVVTLTFGAGLHRPEVRASARLGQVHRARPLTGVDLFQISCL